MYKKNQKSVFRIEAAAEKTTKKQKKNREQPNSTRNSKKDSLTRTGAMLTDGTLSTKASIREDEGDQEQPQIMLFDTDDARNCSDDGGGVDGGEDCNSTATSSGDSCEQPVGISHDVYNMFFLSNWFGPAFYYAFYVWFLKLALYTFLAIDAIDAMEVTYGVQKKVLAAQFLILPVAVAMQEDLINTYYMLANVKYSHEVQAQHRYASKLKYNISLFMRGADGIYSLFVNFVILVKATEVLSLFLNFAALNFLQHIDDIALRLAADGYLTDRLEQIANDVKRIKLPKKRSQVSYPATDCTHVFPDNF